MFGSYSSNAIIFSQTYCWICLEHLGTDERKDEHKQNKHARHIDNVTADSRMKDYFNSVRKMTVRGADSTVLASIPIFIHNPQLWVLNAKNTSMSGELVKSLRRYYYGETGVDNMLISLLETYLLKNDYECSYCGVEYDSFPSIELVHSHMKVCSSLRS